jgi:AbrB family looped-hinge helix DNA binding protein
MANGNISSMKSVLKVDKAGRIVLPLAVRRRFHLENGSSLGLEVGPDSIVLRPKSRTVYLMEDHGMMVHEGEPAGGMENIVGQVRQSRDRDVGGIG